MNLRALAEHDLETTLTGDFGLPVMLIPPDGDRFDTTADGRPLKGRFLWSQPTVDLDTGEKVSVPAPVLTLRRSDLIRVPETGENWFVDGPKDSCEDAEYTTYKIDTTHALDGGKSLGKIRLPLLYVEQGVAE
ncbi:hypothetical protein LQZ19_08700 [Treponema primitia]|uniref:hypothetical protein n=1 Tax=Treponema primitia TaxID=88058 RepID=UPI003980880B